MDSVSVRLPSRGDRNNREYCIWRWVRCSEIQERRQTAQLLDQAGVVEVSKQVKLALFYGQQPPQYLRVRTRAPSTCFERPPPAILLATSVAGWRAHFGARRPRDLQILPWRLRRIGRL
jgi:hypothetical protein